MAIASIVAIALVALSMYSSRSLAGMFNYVDLDHDNRLALDVLSREIRQTRALAEYSSTQLRFVDFDGVSLIYQYNPDARTLVRTKNGEAQTLLTHCDSFTFQVYKTNPLPGTFNQDPATNAAVSKVIGMNWVCSRRVLGGIKNSESAQSAKIVIRKS